ncbi:MAG: hypothetical protein GXP27_10230 [Planctomycetes bacterium]|nr:hypothetical protein [Planctomycetota bacterium]
MLHMNRSATAVLMGLLFAACPSGCHRAADVETPTETASWRQTVEVLTHGAYRPSQDETTELRKLVAELREKKDTEIDEAELQAVLHDAARKCHKAIVWYILCRMAHANSASQKELRRVVLEETAKAKCPDVPDLTEYPACFILPRNFQSLVFYPDSYGGRYVAYIATEPFPAERLIGLIRSELKSKGWKRLDAEPAGAESESPLAQNWRKFVDHTSGTGKDAVWVWRAQWTDQQGNRVEYMCAYRERYTSDRDALLALEKDPTNDSVSVVASWTPAP